MAILPPVRTVYRKLGVRPVNALKAELEGKVENLCIVGNAVSSGTIADAVHSAYDKINALK